MWWDAAVMGHVIVKVTAIDRNDSVDRIGLSKYCIYMYPCVGWCGGDVRVRPDCSLLGDMPCTCMSASHM